MSVGYHERYEPPRGAWAAEGEETMTCYQRHLGSLFEALGLDYDKDNRRRVDDAIRRVLEVPEGAHCPEVWSAIKALSSEQLDALPARLTEVL